MSRVRPDHIAYLVSKLPLDEKERQRLQDDVLAGKAIARTNALKMLDEQTPGTRVRLESIWTAYGRQSIFLWEMPALVDYESPEAFRAAVTAAVRKSIGTAFKESQLSEEWTRLVSANEAEIPVTEEDDEEDDDAVSEILPPPRVLRVRMVGERFEATVRLTRYMHYVYEDAEKRQPITQDVSLSIDLKHNLALVFGGQQQARKTARAFLEWLELEPLPQRNPALARHMKPFRFTEDHVRALAARLQLDFVGMSGADSRDVAGRVAFEGKMAGYRMAPLDLNDDRIKSQEDTPQDLRNYNWDFQHPEDGFVEHGRVAFILDSRHSHISFDVRTSQPAMASVVREIFTEVTPGV